MTAFDQRGQTVNNQLNIAGNFNFDSVHSKAELILELRKLQEEVLKAGQTGELNKDSASNAETSIKNAASQADTPKPDKQGVLKHLSEAKTILDGFTSATGLVSALVKAAQLVGDLL